ncbi:Ribonucleoside-triphosphate reductase, anaerobic [Alteracholeplasma palmae J233]|uniref:Ribonucleoside-triphosphate reductase, anaerobic n=1 Tax=Alteracholeplasma palmae (strain ATCC 49389 / J233) TaxID=1318466 RepID=U4KR03_ALTPJ|nr:anaerobic ribonucleoside triphosphate reductase [Alteracholeplasma palmae]CCV63751.1 Ribonucleoside-triphosphate reductase, anaerobic [Alteracholeplasma palmae J233]
MITKIRKRDGRIVRFNQEKIISAIQKSMVACGMSIEGSDKVTNDVVDALSEKYVNVVPTVENIQDEVELALIHNEYAEVAKSYILYREERNRVRDKNTRLMKTYHDITFSKSNESDLKRENANINSDTAMGAMLKYGSEGAKEFFKMFVLNPKHAKAHEEGLIHIHDLDFLTLTLTCCQIDLTKLFKGGFITGHGSIREPKDIKTYAALACIAIQSNQNDQHGGQSVANFDYDMSEGVRKTYYKNFIKNLEKAFDFYEVKKDAKEFLESLEVKPSLDNVSVDAVFIEKINHPEANHILNFVKKYTKEETIKDTYQAMESLIHNLNTMHSRAGAQVPFSSINYGTDTSPEGRLVVEQILKATQRGLGEGETPIFPIQIFKVKEGVNFNPEDPNYDLFKLSIETSAKRLFPNFSFIDAPFNKAYYKEGDRHTEVAYMGCRTRVMANVYDKDQEVVTGRGNLSFTSINLPRLALTSKNIEEFYKNLDNTLDLVIEQLLERFDIQKKLHVYNFPFLMGQGVWRDSDKLKPTDTIEEVIKHGTLAAGFIGLGETLKTLTGKHHGESKESQKLGLEIISFMRKKMDDAAEKYKLNFSLIATPAEGLSGRFVKMDRKRFGSIEGVTNHEFYTNSFHVPVYYPITAYEKIDIEAPYHALTNGGHISYIEVDGDPAKNTLAFETIIRHMKEKGIGYGSINHSVDYDPECKYVGIINEECPKCGRKETPDRPFERIRRITGYLVGTLDRFNNAKRKEVEERVKHFRSEDKIS